MAKAIVPQNPSNQLPLFPEPEKPRVCLIDGKAHISILDAYRIHGKSKNASLDWKRDKAELERQGYNISNLIGYAFPGADGKMKKLTPVANEEQIARIAQVAKFPEWEPIRQRMAELYIAEKHGELKEAIPFPQSKKYRELIDSGYSHEQALEWHDVDQQGLAARKRIAAEWHGRHGNIAKLTNVATKIATGESATALKHRWSIKKSPRAYLSSFKKAAIALVEDYAVIVHRRRNSDGTDALEKDLTDMAEVINWDKLDSMFPDTDVNRPLPNPEQPPLLSAKNNYAKEDEI